MNAETLLAELRRRGIAVQPTAGGRLRLTGPSEAGLTPELRRDVQNQRADLLALLRTETGAQGGFERALPAHQAPTSGPGPADQRSADAPEAQSGGDGTIPEWLAWGVAVAGMAALAIGYYLFGRPQAPNEPELPPSPSIPPGWPYNGWETWGQ